jgi:hypothetical protein
MITNPLIERGEEIGLRRGLQQSIIRFLSHRFQQIPEDLQKKISSLTDVQKLQNLLDASLEVDSLEQLKLNGFFDN